ncbi:methylenetetrahydrofolate reductase C-terminal domain-containing protein [Chloroflexota bacterium]
MLITEQKPIEEIMQNLDGENNVFLVGCKGCAEGCESGGETEVSEMKQKLEEAGKKIAGISMIDFMCNPSLVRQTLGAHEAKVIGSDSLMVLCCGVGVQTIAEVVDKVVHPGCNTISLGGAHAEWGDADRYCMECGDCVLEYTGGICPIAGCSKNLFHGPCGGSEGGKCEVNPDIPCAWHLIIERLSKLDRLDKLEELVPPKNWGVSLTGGPPRPQ